MIQIYFEIGCGSWKMKIIAIARAAYLVRGINHKRCFHQPNTPYSKMRSINHSFVCMLISPLGLVNTYKKQKKFEVKMRRRGLMNMQTKE